MQPITLPELGEGIAGGDVLAVMMREGDTVAVGQTLLEIETDKAVVEVPAPRAGRVGRVHVKPGDKAKVGQVLCEMEGGDETPAAAPATAPAAASAAEAAPAEVEVKLPELGEGIAGGDVVSVRVKAGDRIERDQTLLEIETDKAVVEVPSPVAGEVASVAAKSGVKLKVGSLICVVRTSGKPAAIAAESATPAVPAAEVPVAAASVSAAAQAAVVVPALPAPEYGAVVPAGPAVRRLARELGADLRQVRGTGRFGRITLDDLKGWVKGRLAGAPAAQGPAVEPLEDFSKYGPVEKVALSSLRKKIAAQMELAWRTPMVTHFDEVDVTEVEAWRKERSAELKAKGASLTITAIAIKACAAALREFPGVNASIDLARGEMVLKRHYHIGVAVDTPAGLIVPVVRDADTKTLTEISLELAALAARAKERKLGVEDLRGATFTITNLGGLGGVAFTPIVNPPQAAILGIARGALKPVWNGKKFEPRLMLPLCLSYDHRVIDGADGARFTSRVARLIAAGMELAI
jgi:pyruvate dehydrogenase E2 component (dihydrolipoamide acetyltransferase)